MPVAPKTRQKNSLTFGPTYPHIKNVESTQIFSLSHKTQPLFHEVRPFLHGLSRHCDIVKRCSNSPHLKISLFRYVFHFQPLEIVFGLNLPIVRRDIFQVSELTPPPTHTHIHRSKISEIRKIGVSRFPGSMQNVRKFLDFGFPPPPKNVRKSRLLCKMTFSTGDVRGERLICRLTVQFSYVAVRKGCRTFIAHGRAMLIETARISRRCVLVCFHS